MIFFILKWLEPSEPNTNTWLPITCVVNLTLPKLKNTDRY